MCHVVVANQLRARCLFQPGRSVITRTIFGRFASSSQRRPNPPKTPAPGKSAGSKGAAPVTRQRRPHPSKEASPFILANRKDTSVHDIKTGTIKIDRTAPSKIIPGRSQRGRRDKPSGTVVVDEEEAAKQREILKNRRKILWPGIWTFFAVAGTCGSLAYLDAKYSARNPPSENQLPDRINIPQTWYLGPDVIKEGIKAGWREIDKLTIGIVVACIAIHLLKKSPLPIWEHLIHISGEKKYTAFTYPYVHATWWHVGQNKWGIIWFMPGVVHAFDGDLFHAAAFYTTVPLITSYLAHFVFRWGNVSGLPFNMGSSGAMAALLGVFCVTYPDEKIWVPESAIFRIDAKYYAALFFVGQFIQRLRQTGGGTRPAFIVHIISLMVGGAYAYFDGKNQIWKPLVARFAKGDDRPA